MGFEAIRVCSGVVEGFPVVQVAICHFSVRGVQNVGRWRTRSSRILVVPQNVPGILLPTICHCGTEFVVICVAICVESVVWTWFVARNSSQ